ncbi:MAG: helix-turn-helix transcriptional regulator [Bacillota bacterium]
MDIYDRINIALKRKKDTRKHMCEVLDISYHTLNSLYKRRTERIPFQVVKNISNYLGLTVQYLIFGVETTKEDILMSIFSSLPNKEKNDVIEYAKYLQSKIILQGDDLEDAQ